MKWMETQWIALKKKCKEYFLQPIEATKQYNLFLNRNADYKYALSYIGDTSILNILPEYEGLHNFRATLGHLVNHSFKKMSEYILATHPR